MTAAPPPAPREPAPREPARLAPRAWLVWSLAAVTVALVIEQPRLPRPGRPRGPERAADLAAPRPPPAAAGRGPGPGRALLATLINLLFSHTGANVIARLPGLAAARRRPDDRRVGGVRRRPWVWVWWRRCWPSRRCPLVLEPHDVVDALPARMERTGIAVATSLNLVSGFGRTFTEVATPSGCAAGARAASDRGTRSWCRCVLTAIEDSVLLAEAMEARAFGAGRRSSYYVRRAWGPWSIAVVAGALAAAAALRRRRALAGIDDGLVSVPDSGAAADPAASSWRPACALALPAFGGSAR